MLFDASVAVQVTVVVPTGNCDPAGGAHTTVGVPQLSVAAGVVKFTAVIVANGHDGCAVIVIASGHPFVNTGGCVSFTVTVKLHIASGGTPLVAVQVTVVVPTTNTVPEAGEQLTVGDGTPVAVTVKLTVAEHWPDAAFAITGLAGQVIVGGVPTVKSAEAVFPVPPLVEVTAPVVLCFTPDPVPITVTEN